MKKTVWALTLLLTLPASAGHERGNGADLLDGSEAAAWFLGDRPIRYCYSVGADFGADAQKIETALRRSFDLWDRYLRERKLNENRPVDYRIATQGKALPSCDGTEDIRFYFGDSTEEVRKHQSRYFNPVGFAAKTEYDLERRWGKGLIWIAPERSVDPKLGLPDWSKRYALDAILVHELGHVFGCGEVEGTVMSKDLPLALSSKPWDSPVSIDGVRELAFCAGCRTEFVGELIPEVPDVLKVYALLLGRAPVGDFSARLVLESDLRAMLSVQDRQGNVTLPIRWQESSTQIEHSGPVLQAIGKPWSGSSRPSVHAERIAGFVNYGELQAAGGAKFNLVIERNVATRSGFRSTAKPVRIRFFLNGTIQDLFVGVPERVDSSATPPNKR